MNNLYFNQDDYDRIVPGLIRWGTAPQVGDLVDGPCGRYKIASLSKRYPGRAVIQKLRKNGKPDMRVHPFPVHLSGFKRVTEPHPSTSDSPTD